nr:hypothetical protein GCM10020185_37950 [Pseudomonas brassicacearum subsp. brassicacearum]
MARQVAGDHRELLLQGPLDQMAIQPHVIVVTVEHKQGRHGLFRPPDLADQLIPSHLETPQPLAHAALGKVQAIEPLVGLGLLGQGLPLGQRLQAGTQEIGVESGRHQDFQA